MKKVFRSTHIPLDVTHVQGIGDKVSLKTSKEDLMALVGTLEVSSELPAKSINGKIQGFVFAVR